MAEFDMAALAKKMALHVWPRETAMERFPLMLQALDALTPSDLRSLIERDGQWTVVAVLPPDVADSAAGRLTETLDILRNMTYGKPKDPTNG